MNHPKRVIVGLVIVVGLVSAGAPPVMAQGRQHCGQVTRNETWAAGDSPHLIACDVQVRSSTVTIEAGAQVLLREGTDLVIQAGSKLLAEGSEDAVIRFIPVARDDPPGFWGQIRFEPGAEGGRMDWVAISAGGQNDVPMVEVLGGPVAMNHMRLQRALEVPLAMRADVLGPSLEEPGQLSSVAGAACAAMSIAGNGTNAIQVIADADVDITQSQTWSHFCVPYQIGSTITIAGPDAPTLSIGTGVTLQFDGDAGIVAGLDDANTGQIETNGSASEPITLTAKNGQPGGWNGIEVTPYSDGNSFLNTRIENGGRGGRPMVVVRARESFAGLGTSFHDAAGYPLAIRADALANFTTGLATETNPIVVDNGVQRVLVLAEELAVDVPSSAEWVSLGVPYEVEGDLLVAGKSRGAILTLAGGVELVFDRQERLTIGDPAVGSGGLRARGSASRPVVLTGAHKTPGAWTGVIVARDALEMSLDHVVLEYGGAGGGAMLELGDVSSGGVTGSTFRGAAGYPVAVALPSLELLAGEEQQGAGRRNTYEANGTNHILVRGGSDFAKRSVTWVDPGVPVEFESHLAVTRPGGMVLTLKGALQLLFAPDTNLIVGESETNRGSLVIQSGDPATPVMFGSADEAGRWGGIYVYEGGSIQGSGVAIRGVSERGTFLRLAGGVVQLAQLELPGSGQSTGIDVSGATARAEVTSSRIIDHRIGVHTRQGGQLTLTKSVVSGNREWGVLNEDPALCVVARLVYWGSPQGPNDPSDAQDGCLNGAHASPGDRVSDDVDWWPYAQDSTTFPPAPITEHPNRTRIYLPIAYRSSGER